MLRQPSDGIADGVRMAAQRIGKGSEQYAMHIGGQEISAHDPRGGWGFAIGYGAEPVVWEGDYVPEPQPVATDVTLGVYIFPGWYRDKGKGEFGVGWRLSLQTLRLRANRVLGTGWLRTVSGPTVSLAATAEHKVSVTLPDGRVETFDMVVSPTSNLGSLDFTSVTGFVPRLGTRGTLEVLGNRDLLILDGGAETVLVDDATLEERAAQNDAVREGSE